MPRNASTTRGPLLSFDPVGALMAATLTPQTCLALPTQREEPHEFPAVALCERADTEGRSVPHAGLGDAVIECLLTSRELAELLGFSAAWVQDRFEAGGSTRPHQPLDSNLFRYRPKVRQLARAVLTGRSPPISSPHSGPIRFRRENKRLARSPVASEVCRPPLP
jgi:hypothetical protein